MRLCYRAMDNFFLVATFEETFHNRHTTALKGLNDMVSRSLLRNAEYLKLWRNMAIGEYVELRSKYCGMMGNTCQP
jgi:hypothetical protein